MLISLDTLIDQYNLNIRGVIHIGAHYGQEYADYVRRNITSIMFFEPLKDNYEKLLSNINLTDSNFPGAKSNTVTSYNIALGNSTGNISMNVESVNQGMSSSILEPVLHLQQYPHITFDKKEVVKIDKLENIEYDLSKFNMINIDVQGYELEVFKGAGEKLNYIDVIYSEVNRDEVYKNCCKVEEIDEYLSKFNFERVLTSWDGGSWGDALYIKNK